MKVYYLLFAIFIFGTSSYNWGVPKKQDPAITKDTLTYTYQIIHERAADRGIKPDSACTVVNIKYPVFTGQNKLNDNVEHKLTYLFASNDPDRKPDTNLQRLTRNFLKDHQELKQDPKYPMLYKLNSYAKVIRQDPSLAVIEVSGYIFQDGAHGNYLTCFINWDTKANKSIALNDIFINGYKAALNKIAESIFRKEEKLSDMSSLAHDHYFKDNTFALNQNFSITSLGIRFLYNLYEIKPYAAGQTELLIPYAQIITSA